MLVLDNSVTMHWCFENATHPYADSILQQVATDEAFVPVIWRYEVSAVLAKSQKDGILTPEKADAFLLLLDSLNITLDPESADRISTEVHRLAITHRLTSYDAAYLELAIRKQFPLATLDDELIRACKAIGHPLA
ncbi:MAG: type II toxin-antitoxin system VapC family toxin [Acidobacteriaceae bacterium]|nr:type II toxin-antitoxin system VapC family toxin [Acidobacteriaceae bacterium]